MKLIVVVAALALFAGVFCAEECDDNCVSCSDWLSIGVNCFECASGKWMYWNDFSREDIQYYAGTSNYGYCYDDETDCDMSQHRRTTTLSYCYGTYTCPVGTYAEDDSLECLECDQTCETCKGPLATDCTDCPRKYTYQYLTKDHAGMTKGSCTADCTTGYYISGDSCIKCHPDCKECNTFGHQKCFSCTDEDKIIYAEYDYDDYGQCISECTSGSWDSTANRCYATGDCRPGQLRSGQKCVDGEVEDECCCDGLF